MIVTTPVHYTVHTSKSVLIDSQPHIVLICEKFVMERKTDGIRSRRSDKFHVLPGDIVILEQFPEFRYKVRSYRLAEHFINEAFRIGLVKSKHISFRIQPVAQISTLDKKFATIRLNQVLSGYTYKSLGSRYSTIRLYLFLLAGD